MPHKQWAIGEEVLAADMQTFIQNQTVSTHATAAARATAIPTPVKGMCSTRDDLPGVVEVWDGSAWVATSQSYTSGVWATYTPAWRAGGSSAGLSVGSTGNLSGWYRMLAPHTLAIRINITLAGTGINGGTGLWDFGYPAGAGSIVTLGVGSTVIVGSNPLMGTAYMGSLINAGAISAAGVSNWWNATHPIAWPATQTGMIFGIVGISTRWLA